MLSCVKSPPFVSKQGEGPPHLGGRWRQVLLCVRVCYVFSRETLRANNVTAYADSEPPKYAMNER